MNTGIQDAVNLAWKLALVVQKKSPDSFAEQLQRGAGTCCEDGVDSHRQLHPAWPLCRARWVNNLGTRLLPILTGIHLVEDRIAETMAEIGIHYRRSSIVSGKTGPSIHPQEPRHGL